MHICDYIYLLPSQGINLVKAVKIPMDAVKKKKP